MTGTILQANKGLDEAITARGFFSDDVSSVHIFALKPQFQIFLSTMTPTNTCGLQESVSSLEIQPGELSCPKP